MNGKKTATMRATDETREVRAFAEVQYRQVSRYLSHAEQWDEVQKTTDIAKSELHAARLLLDLPPGDMRYRFAPFVALEALQRAAMMYGMAAGDMLGEISARRQIMKAQTASRSRYRAGRTAILSEYKAGNFKSKNVAAKYLSEKHFLAETTVRKMLAGV